MIDQVKFALAKALEIYHTTQKDKLEILDLFYGTSTFNAEDVSDEYIRKAEQLEKYLSEKNTIQVLKRSSPTIWTRRIEHFFSDNCNLDSSNMLLLCSLPHVYDRNLKEDEWIGNAPSYPSKIRQRVLIDEPSLLFKIGSFNKDCTTLYTFFKDQDGYIFYYPSDTQNKFITSLVSIPHSLIIKGMVIAHKYPGIDTNVLKMDSMTTIEEIYS